MITPLASDWQAKNNALAKKPIYVFNISGQAVNYTTHDLAAEGVTGTLPVYSTWLKTPDGSSQSIDVQQGTSSIGELQIEVVDLDGSVRQLVGENVIEGQTATLLVGYPGIAWTSFVPVATHPIYKIVPQKGYTSWIFNARDQLLSTKRQVWYHPENGQAISGDNPWVIQGTPGEIIQAVYLAGLQLPLSAVDHAGLAELDTPGEGMYVCARPFQFVMTQAFEAKTFIEQEICKVCGCYQVVLNTGQISLRAPRPPAAGPSGLFTFTEDNMTVLPEFDRLDVYNEVIVNMDWDGTNYNRQLVFIEANSVDTFGTAQQLNIDSQGLKSVFGGVTFATGMVARYFRRFAGTPAGLKGGAPTIKIEAFFMTLPVWVGDYVLVTHPLMPDILSGALGVTNRLYEVIDREPAYSKGRMEYTLMDTGLTGLAAAKTWATSSNEFVIGSSAIY